MMHLTNMIVARMAPNRISGANLQRLAEEIAEHALPAVLQRSRPRAVKMRMAEARGYIRARAALVIHQQVDAELQHRAAAQVRYRSELIERATEAVIGLALSDMATRQIVGFRLARAA
jgi:hypothetical protein